METGNFEWMDLVMWALLLLPAVSAFILFLRFPLPSMEDDEDEIKEDCKLHDWHLIEEGKPGLICSRCRMKIGSPSDENNDFE